MGISKRAGAAFVDIGAVRKIGKARGGGEGEVLGMLRFEDFDVVAPTDDDDVDEEDGDGDRLDLLAGMDLNDDLDEELYDREEQDEEIETEEDISDQIQIGEDGSVYSIDPSTGEQLDFLGDIEDDDEEEEDNDDDDDDDDDEENPWGLLSPKERILAVEELLGRLEGANNDPSPPKKSPAKKRLQVGSEVDVYIKNVSLQSGRFKLSCDPRTAHVKQRDLRQGKVASKRLDKLSRLLGGERGVEQYLSLEGTEAEGIIRATSQTGLWYYVQPTGGGHDDLPVGVASPMGAEDSAEIESFSPGDKVRIRFAGIDEGRGQIAMDLVGGVGV
mmetsp:Transcript_8806/g.19387  ORF Transcript_8806/g.19387 Transcript_8806/m.19387 type:complete len:330 (-) Transcript_8806:170-1159(-)